MIAGGAVVLFAGPGLFWALVALALAALLIAQFVTFQEPIRPAEEKADDTVAALPPMTRVLLDQLPIPVMLLDDEERVLFVNYSMRDVLGPGLDRKRASSVLRNPDVLAAITEAGRGFSDQCARSPCRCPIERHFQAYAARISVSPPVTALLLHDLTVMRRSEQMRADFVANASHELRTPLAAVSGFIDTLRGHAKDDEVAREQVPRHHERGSGAHAPADRRSSVAHPHRDQRACAAGRPDRAGRAWCARPPPRLSRWRRRTTSPSRGSAAGPAAGDRRARRADAAVPEPDPQRHQIWPRRMARCQVDARPMPGRPGRALTVRDDGEGIAARAPSPA